MRTISIGGVVSLTEEQATHLHQFLTSPEYDRGLRPILTKLSEAYLNKSMSVVPKDQEGVYDLGVIRGKVDVLRFLLSDLSSILSQSRK